MFAWALASGIFSYYLLGLGIIGKLEYPYILFGTAAFIIYTYFCIQRKLSVQNLGSFVQKFYSLDKLEKTAVGLISAQILCNLVGALGPEIAYDAVWYHLTIPRIWLMEHTIFHIPHGPFSYSLLPKLLDVFYIAALSLSNEVAAKLIHWGFGILCGYALYYTARHFTTRKYSLLTLVLFYSNLVVGWQSITAYIDLGRTFYETLALLALIYSTTTNSSRWRYIAAAMIGLAILSKLLALTSLAALVLILLYQRKMINAFICLCIVCMMPAPWFVLNFMQTGNPVFPVFSSYDLSSTSSLVDGITIWFTSADPLSPLYAMFAPLYLASLVPSLKKIIFQPIPEKHKKSVHTLILYSCLLFALWVCTPRTGGGRFILPYLPAFSVVAVYVLSLVKVRLVRLVSISAIVLISIFSLFYRAYANMKYLPVILGTESKQEFLRKQLPKDFGDNWYYLDDASLKRVYTESARPEGLHWQYD